MRIACISAGKDSVAMLILCLRAGIRFDHIYWVYMRGAEWDETLEFVRHTLNPYLDAVYRCVVEIVPSDVSYDDVFYRRRVKGKHVGYIYGFNFVTIKGACSYKRDAKIKTLDRLYGKGNDIYIGFAANEADRANSKQYKDDKYNRYHFPLVEAGITERQCRAICEQYGVLHPFYRSAQRMGCWQCACQPLGQLRNLYFNYPKKWEQLQRWQDDCAHDFKPGGVRIEHLAQRFSAEGMQLSMAGQQKSPHKAGRKEVKP